MTDTEILQHAEKKFLETITIKGGSGCYTNLHWEVWSGPVLIGAFKLEIDAIAFRHQYIVSNLIMVDERMWVEQNKA